MNTPQEESKEVHGEPERSREEPRGSVIAQVHEARKILLAGRPAEALEMIRTVAEPYSTLHIVRGECYYALEDFREAREEFKQALVLSPNSPRAEILLELTTDLCQLRESAMQEGPPPTFALLFGEDHEEDASLDLEHLASELVRAAPIAASETPMLGSASSENTSATVAGNETDSSDAIGLVSETLARIMVKQGKIEEARKVYIQLARLDPGRYEYFRERIAELERA